jgi:uncharacterized protein YukE
MTTDFSKYSHQQLYDMVHNMNSDGGIDAIASNATGAAQQLELMVTQYLNQVAGIGQSWTGKAADSYMQFASGVGTAAQALTDQMTSVGGTLSSVSCAIEQAKSDMPPVPTDAINQLNQWKQTTPVSGRAAGLSGGYTQTEITSGVNANQATINQAHSKAVATMNNLASTYPIYTRELTSSNSAVLAATPKVRDTGNTSTGSASSTSNGGSNSSSGSSGSAGRGSSGAASTSPRSYGTYSSRISSPNGYKVAPISGTGLSLTSSTTSGGPSGGRSATPPTVGEAGSTTGSSGSSLAGVGGSGSGYTAGSSGLGGLSSAVGSAGEAGTESGFGGVARFGGFGRSREAVGGGGGYEGTGSTSMGSGSSRTTTSRIWAGTSGEDGAAGSFGDSGAIDSAGQSGADSGSSSPAEGGMMGGMGTGGSGAGGGQSQRRERAKYLTQDPEWWYGDALKNNLPVGGLIEE